MDNEKEVNYSGIEECESVESYVDSFMKNLMSLAGVTISCVETLSDINTQESLSTSDLKSSGVLVKKCSELLNLGFRGVVSEDASDQELEYTVGLVDTGLDADITMGDSFANIQSYLGEARTSIRRLQAGEPDASISRTKEIIMSAFGTLGSFVLSILDQNEELVNENAAYSELHAELKEFESLLDTYKKKDFYKETKTVIIVDGGLKEGDTVKYSALSFDSLRQKRD